MILACYSLRFKRTQQKSKHRKKFKYKLFKQKSYTKIHNIKAVYGRAINEARYISKSNLKIKLNFNFILCVSIKAQSQ